MFAIGATMVVVGLILTNVFGEPFYGFRGVRRNTADKIGLPMAIVGVLFLGIGMFQLAWRYLP